MPSLRLCLEARYAFGELDLRLLVISNERVKTLEFACPFIRSDGALIHTSPAQFENLLRKQSGRNDEDSLESSAVEMAKMFDVTSEKAISFGCYSSGKNWRILGWKTYIRTWTDRSGLNNALAPIIQTCRPYGSFEKEISFSLIPYSGVSD